MKITSTDYKKLREQFDPDEPIMINGLQPKGPRYMQTHRRSEEETAPFLYHGAGTRKFLLKCFPGLIKRDPHDVRQAAAWYEVILHYWRLGWTDRRIEEDQREANRQEPGSGSFLLMFPGSVGFIVQQIRRKIKGLRRNGKPYSTRKPGRPRRIVMIDESNK